MRTDAALPGTEITRAVESLLRAEPARMAKLLDALRAPGRYVESTVQGMSMGRGLPSGSRIRIELVTPECFAVGTVIAFLAGEHLVVHRVLHNRPLGLAANLLLTRGDMPLVPDRPVAYSRILGPVTGVWRNGEWQAPPAEPRRAAHARLISSILVLATLGMLRLSTRGASVMLDQLHQLERAVREARNKTALAWGHRPPGPG